MTDETAARAAQDLLDNIQAYVKAASRRLEVTFLPATPPTPRAVDVPALLRSLVERTGETAVLAATSGTSAVFLEAVESPHAIRYTAPPGKLIPLHVTATGRALLSLLSPADRAGVLRRATFERYTPTTLMSVAAVEKEIQRSLQRGWFEGAAEYTVDLGGVAMPLQVPHRQFAVLVAGPMSRVKTRGKELARIMSAEIDHHLAELIPAEARQVPQKVR